MTQAEIKALQDKIAEQTKMLADNKTEIATLTTDNTALKGSQTQSEASAKSLTDEAAETRIQLKEQRKQNYVLGNILGKNNINFDVATYDMKDIKLEDGKVVGDVNYNPVSPMEAGAVMNPAILNEKGGVEVGAIHSMSREQIRENWGSVEAALQNQ
ncbi:MAG: hypothetical protein HAW67_02050 [Endozoicomonadaceae bacterium]|nr:hypothetical protein [Endozoicomonadaceae bacterium]